MEIWMDVHDKVDGKLWIEELDGKIGWKNYTEIVNEQSALKKYMKKMDDSLGV